MQSSAMNTLQPLSLWHIHNRHTRELLRLAIGTVKGDLGQCAAKERAAGGLVAGRAMRVPLEMQRSKTQRQMITHMDYAGQ